MEDDLGNMPVYVKIDDYKNLIELLDILKKKLEEARVALQRVQELKGKEDAEIELWQTELTEVERKIEFIDRALFQPRAL